MILCESVSVYENATRVNEYQMNTRGYQTMTTNAKQNDTIQIRTVLNQYFLRYNKFRRINAIQAREPQPMMIDWYTAHTYLLVRYCD